MVNKKIIIAITVIIIIAVGIFSVISVNTHKSKIEVVSNSTLKNGDSFEIVLKDDYKNVIPNQVVSIKILGDNGWGSKYNVTTDENGHASVQLNALDNGNYTVHSTFDGTMFLAKCKSVNELTINDGL